MGSPLPTSAPGLRGLTPGPHLDRDLIGSPLPTSAPGLAAPSRTTLVHGTDRDERTGGSEHLLGHATYSHQAERAGGRKAPSFTPLRHSVNRTRSRPLLCRVLRTSLSRAACVHAGDADATRCPRNGRGGRDVTAPPAAHGVREHTYNAATTPRDVLLRKQRLAHPCSASQLQAQPSSYPTVQRNGRSRLPALTPPTSAPGLGSPRPHLRRDWAPPAHICAGTGLPPPTSAPGLGSPLPTSVPGLGSPLRACHWLPGLGRKRAKLPQVKTSAKKKGRAAAI